MLFRSLAGGSRYAINQCDWKAQNLILYFDRIISQILCWMCHVFQKDMNRVSIIGMGSPFITNPEDKSNFMTIIIHILHDTWLWPIHTDVDP